MNVVAVQPEVSIELPPSVYGEVDEPSPISPNPAAFTDQTDHQIRCGKCNKLLVEFATRPYQVRCSRCKTVTGAQPRPL